jgi:hypothetical protein
MMWWKSKDDDSGNKSPNGPADPLKTPRGLRGATKSMSNGLSSRRRRRGNRSNEKGEPTTPKTPHASSAVEKNRMCIGETLSGIEVSLSQEIRSPSSLTSPPQQMYLPLKASLILSLTEALEKRGKRVHRSQFSNSNWPLLKKGPQDPLPPSSPDGPAKALTLRPHRVPLSGKPVSALTYDSVMSMLQSYEVVDEVSCVREEMTRMNSEIEALEQDRASLEEKRPQLPVIPIRVGGAGSSKDNTWNVHYLLSATKSPKLSPAERNKLQEHRGLSLTICIHNEKAQEAFLSKCGSKAATSLSQLNRNQSSRPTMVTLDPNNCRDGGAATTIQHVSLLTGSPDTAFFISRDSGKANLFGHLPEKLFRRMKSAGQKSSIEFVYLSTGPLGSYYAELRSGECWWGSPLGDEDFHSICSEWDVYRVAFGSTTAVDARHTITSWIILGCDGRVAWKNLPLRLHNKLKSRLADEAAPVEVTLGSGNSYFIRFLDGSFDYCLPASAAEVCRKLEEKGAAITSVSLHPELSHDFVIRHRCGK